jgi:hypothetical protein
MSPAVVMRWEAGRGAGVDALGEGGEAWVDVALREAIDVLLRRFVRMLDVRGQVLKRAVPPRITAPVHFDRSSARDNNEAGRDIPNSQL